MNRFVILFLISLLHFFQAFSVDVSLDNGEIFRGDTVKLSGKLYYTGTIYHKDLSESVGMFDSEFNALKGVLMAPNGGRIFVDSLSYGGHLTYTKIFAPGEVYWEKFGDTPIRAYLFDKGYWVSNETAYDNQESKDKSFLLNTEDRIMIQGVKWFLYLGIIFLYIISSVNFILPNHQIKPLTTSVFVVIALLLLFFIVVDNKYTDWVFLLPLCLWGGLLGLSIITPPRLSKLLRLASILLPLLLVGFQFCFTRDSISLSDGKKLPIEWRPGTDIIKRAIIKNVASKMIVVDNDGNYLCKNELTELEYAIISGDFGSWMKFITPNAVKSSITLDEAQMLVRNLNDLIGHQYFYVPTEEVWNKAISSSDIPLVKNTEGEAHGINKGIISEKGFVDLYGNLIELTSTGRAVPYTNANFMPINLPENIIIKGRTYRDFTNFDDNSIFPKNFTLSTIGLRLSLRASQPKVSTKVYGLLLDTTGSNLPIKIELLEINGSGLNQSWSAIERKLIEMSAETREYTVKTSTGDVKKIKIERNTEPYIFTPMKM